MILKLKARELPELSGFSATGTCLTYASSLDKGNKGLHLIR